jgi:outer membrane protein OmpA-like peptidoglycan-associated protein
MPRIRLTQVLVVALLTAGTPAVAQVTVDLHALQALPERAGAGTGAIPAPRRVAPLPRQVPVNPGAVASAPTTTVLPPISSPATTPSAATPPAAQPVLPQSVPNVAAIPPVAPPTETTAAPPPPSVVADAPTKAEPVSQGLRLLFGAGSSDLSPDSAASLKALAGSASQTDTTSFNVAAYAPANRDDPSTARRLSLARAMAVRSALIGGGVASARIYVRALGDAAGAGSADRVDVSVLGTNADSTAQAPPK